MILYINTKFDSNTKIDSIHFDMKVTVNDVVAAIINNLLAALVMDKETGEMLEFRQLRSHPKYKQIWDTSYANELGRL